MNSHSHSPCAACKCLRRKCTQECVFAPYFPSDQPQKFAFVHKVYGASNVTKLLNELNPSQREDAVNSLAYEAEARLRDPVYGCVGFISLLQLRLKELQGDLFNAKKELSTYIGSKAMLPILQPPMLGPQQEQHLVGIPSQYNMPHTIENIPMQGIPLVIREPRPLVQPHHQNQVLQHVQQQQIIQAQQFVASATTVRDQPHQEMILNYNAKQQQQQLQQQEILNFNSGEGFNLMAGSVTTSGFNTITMPVGASASSLSPSLALGTYENPNGYQIQAEEGENPISQHTFHSQFQEQLLLQSHAVPAEAEEKHDKPEDEDRIGHP